MESDVDQIVEAGRARNDCSWSAASPNAMQDGQGQGSPVHSQHPPAKLADMDLLHTHEPHGLLPMSGLHSPMLEDMVVAAVISLQDPLGSGPDEICTWIEGDCKRCHSTPAWCVWGTCSGSYPGTAVQPCI